MALGLWPTNREAGQEREFNTPACDSPPPPGDSDEFVCGVFECTNAASPPPPEPRDANRDLQHRQLDPREPCLADSSFLPCAVRSAESEAADMPDNEVGKQKRRQNDGGHVVGNFEENEFGNFDLKSRREIRAGAGGISICSRLPPVPQGKMAEEQW